MLFNRKMLQITGTRHHIAVIIVLITIQHIDIYPRRPSEVKKPALVRLVIAGKYFLCLFDADRPLSNRKIHLYHFLHGILQGLQLNLLRLADICPMVNLTIISLIHGKKNMQIKLVIFLFCMGKVMKGLGHQKNRTPAVSLHANRRASGMKNKLSALFHIVEKLF